MADFLSAYKKVMNLEGFYSNVIGDPGGETWKGIARNYNPTWGGWAIIDLAKESINPVLQLSAFNAYLNSVEQLETLVQQLYKERYWDVFLGDQLVSDSELVQAVADELFDQSVNMGPARAINHLQQALNIFQDTHKLVVDGVFGKMTFNAFKGFLNRAKPIQLKGFLIDLNIQQGAWYHHLALEHGMSKFLGSERGLGWYKRVEL